MRIVAITGKRFSGKTTAAQGLERIGWRHINFADPLRDVVHRVYGVSFEEMLDPVLKETVLDRYPFQSPRFLLQKVGTELFREGIDQDTWIEAFKRAASHYSHVVCSDCRFPNEATTVRSMGGIVIRINNPQVDRTDSAAQHASETEIDKIVADWTVENDPRRNSVEQLRNTIIDIVGA